MKLDIDKLSNPPRTCPLLTLNTKITEMAYKADPKNHQYIYSFLEKLRACRKEQCPWWGERRCNILTKIQEMRSYVRTKDHQTRAL